MAWNWKDAPELMAALTRCQNHPAFEHQDILSFAGLCDSADELELHVARCEITTQNYDQDAEHGL